jgi:hypothetical protein
MPLACERRYIVVHKAERSRSQTSKEIQEGGVAELGKRHIVYAKKPVSVGPR